MKRPETCTKVYAADVTALENPELYARAYSMSSPSRREKADRYLRERDKRLALGAGMLLKYGLTEAGIENIPESFEYGENGKPFLRSGKIHFNISHSGTWAICAVSGFDVGCDIEKIRKINIRTAGLFAPEEYDDILSRSPGYEQEVLFCRYWTLKESFMKVTGLGLRMHLNSFRVVPGEPVTVIQSYDDRNYRFSEFDDITGYRCAVCAAGESEPAKIIIKDLADIEDSVPLSLQLYEKR